MKLKLFVTHSLSLFVLWFVSACLVVCADEPQYPLAPDGYIYDGAHIINPADSAKITQLFIELQNKTTAQVAIATVPSTTPESIEAYAVKLFSRWGVGQKGKDNGVLFLIARDDRNLRIEVGYGLEGALPDAICKKVISNIILPDFKNSNFSGGILKGATAIVSLVAKEYNVAITGDENDILNRLGTSGNNELFWLILFILVVVIVIGMSGGSSGSGGYRGGGYWQGGGSGGFGGGFGGGSGGFGGFGGGMGGGGGASGRW